MEKIKRAIKTSLIGGTVVVLPVVIVAIVFRWLFRFLTNTIQPLTDLVGAGSHLPRFPAGLVSVVLILAVCFVVGVAVRTRLGTYLYNLFERALLTKIPGYSLSKETVLQFAGRKKALFSSVALVDLFEDRAFVTAFVTDEHSDGSYTVFVPTAPNPTSGFIVHVKGSNVHPIDASVEETMKSIISCGLGSNRLVEKHLQSLKPRGAC